MWYDGKCKKCGMMENVEECNNELDIVGDYMNRCTNSNCENHIWHVCFDDEFLDYYRHK